ncbi:MAG TPA: LysR family transcriptional regulator [Ferrovibrio sp.]|jgi:DNA-binding transcriptional LysR family regulator|uniref:LysR family transcriptional regulator n=1 Tax=Ferrovibrio sp. TaxID=1917215 RepID=UPI002B4B2CAF|nr:LysR family transcriptional regulator [Ferrovibrio sp.]HLT77584.1 LysR family transcriptional regulator [Ferrovibrio sp.]
MTVQKRTRAVPPPEQPDWNDLRYALELGRHGTLSGAARALGVNHATVARRIAALESSLKMTLFERGPRGYRATASAAPVLAAAEQVEAPLLLLGRQSDAQHGAEVSGKVRITATEGVASHLIAPGLAGLRQRWPLLEVEILVEHRSLSLARREAEIAIRWARPTKGELFATRLGPVPYRLYRHPRAADQTAVASLDESLGDLPESRWLDRQAGLRQVIRSNSMLPLIAAARTGACAILLPEFVGRRIPELVPEGGKPPVTRDLWLLLHRDLRKAPRVRATADFLIGSIRGSLAER